MTALWAREGLRAAQEELVTLRTNNLRALQALGVRGVNGTQALYASAGCAANHDEARMADSEKIRDLEAARAASMALLRAAEIAAKAELPSRAGNAVR